MSRLRPDFASGKLSDTSITSTQTVLDSGQFVALPVVASPDVIELVLDPFAIYGAQERVIVTNHAATATAVTVTRGAYGSTPRAHNLNGVQEDWCASITDEDFYHSTLYNLSNDDHPQYQNAARHSAAGNHTAPAIISDILGSTGVHLRSQKTQSWTPVVLTSNIGGPTTLSWDTSVLAVGAPPFTGATFTAPVAGFYLISAAVGITFQVYTPSTTDSLIIHQIFIFVNGALLVRGTSIDVNSAALSQGDGLIALTVGTAQLATTDTLSISYKLEYSGADVLMGQGLTSTQVTIDKLTN